MEDKKERQKKYNNNRKREEVICPDCNLTRMMRTDARKKSKSDRCSKCSIKHIRIEQGDALHHLSTHPIYIRWVGMKRRIKDPLKKNSYLDKGIIVCEEWSKNFLPFYEWSIANGYKEDLDLDRIDNNGNYCPENCRYITHRENCNNK
jgi:hypothetical protein